MIELTDEIKTHLANALADRVPVILAYVDDQGSPSLSYRGSAQVFSPTQVAVWARDPGGGLPSAVAARPGVALIYSNLGQGLAFQFYGKARVVVEGPDRDQVYDDQPQGERDRDPEKLGVAVIVDLVRVVGRSSEGRFEMTA